MRRRPVTEVFGRDAELNAVDDLVAAVTSGSGRILVLDGEAGIGKSHLAAEAADRARRAGAVVISGGADDLEQDRPGRILAALSAGLGLPFDQLVDTDDGDQPQDPAFAVVERFTDAVERAAASDPLVLVVEDLHWADDLSLRGIASVARRLGPLPVGLVASTRPVPRPTGLLRLLAVCADAGAQTIVLGGLDPTAVDGLVAAIAGAAPGPNLRRRMEATSGNPLYVTELLRALDDDGNLQIDTAVAETDEGGIPEGLVPILSRRVAGLPAETVEVLQLASILGGEFALHDLATVAGRSAVDVAALLREAVDGALVVAAGESLAFRHDLIREAVYLDIPPAIRTDLHVAAARSLAAAGAPAPRVARQFALGARPGDLEAVDWLHRAAEESLRVDTATAVSLLEQALSLAPSDWERRSHLESTLVELLAWSGRVDDARTLGRSLLDRSLSPADELDARRALAAVHGTVGELADAVEQLELAAALPVVDETLAGVLHCAAAGMAVIAGLRPAEEARAVGLRHLGSEAPALACWAHNTLAVAAVAAGAYDEQLRHAEIAATLLEAHYVPPMGFLIPHAWRSAAQFQLDLVEEARLSANAARQRGERRGDAGLVIHASAALSGFALSTGEWDDAVSESDGALGLAGESGVQAQRLLLNAVQAIVAIGRGDHPTAEEQLREGEDFFASTPQHPYGLDLLLWARAQLLEAGGDTEAARAILQAVWEQTEMLRGLIQWNIVGPDVVRLCRIAGDVDGARGVAAEMAEVAGRSSSASGQAAALRARGLAEDDPDVLLDAVERYRVTPRRIETAAAAEEAGRLLLDHGRRDEGVRLLDEAADLHTRTGATAHVARVDAHLRDAGIRRRRSAASPATHGWESLSPKEREVVALVAEGLNNPEIAARLYISRRTVESHLSHVFRKLGLSNRTQLATAAVEQALDEG